MSGQMRRMPTIPLSATGLRRVGRQGFGRFLEADALALAGRWNPLPSPRDFPSDFPSLGLVAVGKSPACPSNSFT